MAHQSWLECSLQRSASLGLEVLERASRRSVDWTNTGASQTPTTSDENRRIPVTRAHTELNDAFATIAEFMAQTTYHCKKFYESGCCTDPTESERNHMSRFHTQPGVVRPTSALPTSKHIQHVGRVSAMGEDFYIEVSPGAYAITASLPESQQQTRLVSIKAGESINLTFNL
ncbi:A-kinase-interacting protein 1 [Melanotaenia boesemani]|uniref:A-kinase-interacting protein 1 n=1 Tax=Melanotaenia boesemani TaxID=1250792 RepID=UPI001C04F84C|nr:A-kinase-interacting protein 1 [Melanotaenia boesemani]XP_041852877.1 A-kinase-interacting protein 1 [Melanotaenia boesemani]XP_041852878.1 A-kinase-interacting protein 1 [Melanotaenia boesemani]